MTVQNLTDAELERLALLGEEASEIIQIVCKILRHGYESWNPNDVLKTSNRSLLEQELGDFQAVYALMIDRGDLMGDHVTYHQNRKLKKSAKYFHYQND